MKLKLTQQEQMARRQNRVRFLLKERGMLITEIAKALRVSNSTARSDVEAIRAEVHICGYVKAGKAHASIYCYGAKEDAPLPEGWLSMAGRRKVAEPAKAAIGRHWMDVALFGQYVGAA